MESISCEDLTVEVQRKSRRKTMTLKVVRGKIFLVTNKSLSHEALLKFVFAKKTWLQKCLQKHSEQAVGYPQKDGDQIRYFGELVAITKKPTLLSTPFLTHSPAQLSLYLPLKLTQLSWEDLRPTLLKLLQAQAIERITPLFWHWSQKMNLQPKTLKWRHNRGRWGSCSSEKTINLNIKMLVLPLPSIEYILVHELAHLVHLNHSPRFWSLVEAHIPNCRQLDRQLNKIQAWADYL